MGIFFLKKKFLKAGFTLIEILVVLFIVVFVFIVTSNTLFSNKNKLRSSFELLTRLNRKLHSSAKVHGKTYRLVLKLNDRKPEELWVEKQEKKEFVLDEKFFKTPKTLHPLLSIKKAESSYWPESQETGLIHIYYYPKGLGQEVALHISRTDDFKKKWTLYFHPIEKEINVINAHSPLEEIQKQ